MISNLKFPARKFVIQDPESMRLVANAAKKSARGGKVSHMKKTESEVEEGRAKKLVPQKRKEKVLDNAENRDNSDDPDPKKTKREITAYIFVSTASGSVV